MFEPEVMDSRIINVDTGHNRDLPRDGFLTLLTVSLFWKSFLPFIDYMKTRRSIKYGHLLINVL